MAGAERPLAGRRILLTRPADRTHLLESRLVAWGAEVEVRPTIELLPPTDGGPSDQLLTRLQAFDWLVFTSVSGIRFFAARLAEVEPQPVLPSAIAVVGPGSAQAARVAGFSPTLVADEGHAEGLAAQLSSIVGVGSRLLLAGPESPRPLLAQRLQATGAEVEQVACYRNAIAAGAADAAAAICADRFDAVVLASPSALERLVEAARPTTETLLRALARTRIVTIGPVSSLAVTAQGLTVAAVAAQPTEEALAAAVYGLFD